MALSTITDLTKTWVVIAVGEYKVIQNIGNQPVILKWKATIPTVGEGFEVAPGSGADNATFGDGPVWARAAKSVSKVIVNV